MILHVDMDAFYASVEQRDRPELRGLPVVVGGSASGRGVVCAASYEARKFGIHSAMPAAKAKRLCPQAVFIRPRMTSYANVSRLIRDIFGRYTPLVQPLSMDEAFLDVAGSVRLFGSPVEIGRRIKSEILAETGLVASVGVAPNKSLAKIASDLDKPDGFCVVDPEAIQDFLDPLSVSRVWGVGRVAERKLCDLGVETVYDLRQLSEDVLENRLGRWGVRLAKLARGEDHREVIPDHDAKSVSHETTFHENVTDEETLFAWASWLSEQVGRRLRSNARHARTIHIKLRDSDFNTQTRSESQTEPSNRTADIASTARKLLQVSLEKNRRLSIASYRLLGVGVSNINAGGLSQGMLFEDRGTSGRDAVADEIVQKFGATAIRPGNSLILPKRDRDNPYEAQRTKRE